MMRSAASLRTPWSHSLIGGTIRPSSNTEVACEGIEPGTAPPMSSWWPKACTNATTSGPSSVLDEHRHRHAQVRQVPDAALGQVDVVVEEDVARAHRVQREVARDRVHERGVRASGQLAQLAVVDAGAEVVRVADHRRPRGPADRRLDLLLDGRQRALRRSPARSGRPGARCGCHRDASRRTRMLPSSSTARDEAGMQRHGRAELLDDRRSVQLDRRARGQGASRPVCRPSRGRVEEHGAYGGLRAARVTVAGRSSAQRPAGRSGRRRTRAG